VTGVFLFRADKRFLEMVSDTDQKISNSGRARVMLTALGVYSIYNFAGREATHPVASQIIATTVPHSAAAPAAKRPRATAKATASNMPSSSR
jgi:hypothetical protein